MLSTAVLKLDHPFWSSLFRVIAALHKVFQCYSFTSHCFWVGETHAQLRLECGSYIVSARSLTKLATSTTDQPCEGSLFLMVVPAGIEPATRGFSVPCSTDWATEPYLPCLFMPLLWFSQGVPPRYIGQGIVDIILKRVGFEPCISGGS